MALLIKTEELIKSYAECFETLGETVGSVAIPLIGLEQVHASAVGPQKSCLFGRSVGTGDPKKRCLVGGPGESEDTPGPRAGQPMGFFQIFEAIPELKDNKYVQLAVRYMPLAVTAGKLILPYIKELGAGSQLFPILQGLAIIGIGIAAFSALILLKHAIEKDCSNAAAEVKDLVEDTLAYVKNRINRNEQRLEEIQHLVIVLKLAHDARDTAEVRRIIIVLHEKVRVCKLDVDECIEKIEELYQKIDSTISVLNKKIAKSTLSVVGLGVLTVVGAAVATVATGGVALGALAVAGGAGAGTLGFGYHTRICLNAKAEFLRMKVKCDSLLKDVNRQKKKLKSHVKECQDNNIDLGFSLDDL